MNDEGEQTLRQRRQAAASLNIERQAVALVLEHGLDSVTVDMICARSGISQRTFFNYFPTKDAAILGAAIPSVDPQRALEFVAGDGGDVLVEALGVVQLGAGDTSDAALAADRIRVISASPPLFLKQMERMSGVAAEMENLLYLRLRRSAGADESPEATREAAALAAGIIAGVFRFLAERRTRDGVGNPAHGPAAGPADDPAADPAFDPAAAADPFRGIAALLGSVLPRLIPVPGR